MVNDMPVCVRVRVCARVTMPGYRHVRHYGNSLQIKIAYAVDGSERNIRGSCLILSMRSNLK